MMELLSLPVQLGHVLAGVCFVAAGCKFLDSLDLVRTHTRLLRKLLFLNEHTELLSKLLFLNEHTGPSRQHIFLNDHTGLSKKLIFLNDHTGLSRKLLFLNEHTGLLKKLLFLLLNREGSRTSLQTQGCKTGGHRKPACAPFLRASVTASFDFAAPAVCGFFLPPAPLR